MIAVADQAEAECLTTAFHRFIELQGRVASDSRCRCSLTVEPGFGAGQILRASFWNGRAAAKFDAFWPAYQRVYGRAGAYALSPAG